MTTKKNKNNEAELSFEVQELIKQKSELEKEISVIKNDFAKDFENKQQKLKELELEIEKSEKFIEKNKLAKNSLQDINSKIVEAKNTLVNTLSETQGILDGLDIDRMNIKEKEQENIQKSKELIDFDIEIQNKINLSNQKELELDEKEKDIKKLISLFNSSFK